MELTIEGEILTYTWLKLEIINAVFCMDTHKYFVLAMFTFTPTKTKQKNQCVRGAYCFEIFD